MSLGLDSDELRTVVNSNPSQSFQDIAQTMNSSISTVFRNLKEIGKSGKLVPHRMTEK